MTPQQLAVLHAAAFQNARGWSAEEFADLLSQNSVHIFTQPQGFARGFALIRVIADEAELLTIAVDPDAQGQGIGARLMQDWMQGITATEAFLEVAQDNHAAIALYNACGFAKVGRRAAYYRRKDAPSVDAIVMRYAFT